MCLPSLFIIKKSDHKLHLMLYNCYNNLMQALNVELNQHFTRVGVPFKIVVLIK